MALLVWHPLMRKINRDAISRHNQMLPGKCFTDGEFLVEIFNTVSLYVIRPGNVYAERR